MPVKETRLATQWRGGENSLVNKFALSPTGETKTISEVSTVARAHTHKTGQWELIKCDLSGRSGGGGGLVSWLWGQVVGRPEALCDSGPN